MYHIAIPLLYFHHYIFPYKIIVIIDTPKSYCGDQAAEAPPIFVKIISSKL